MSRHHTIQGDVDTYAASQAARCWFLSPQVQFVNLTTEDGQPFRLYRSEGWRRFCESQPGHVEERPALWRDLVM